MEQTTDLEKQNPTFTNAEGLQICNFCHQETPNHTFKIGNVNKRFYFRCKCESATTYWAEFDENDPLSEVNIRRAERQMRMDEIWRRSLIPARWRTRTFEAYQVNDLNREAYELAKSYSDRFQPKNGEGLLLTGKVGTGKTHLAAAIAMQVLERENRVIFGTVTTLLGQIRGAFESDRISEREVMDKFCRCELLVVDDLGKEKVTDWVEQTLYEIINTRYEDNRSIVITSNFELSDLKAKYPNNGEAIIDRILETCEGTQMNWESWRRRGL